jgi:tol-pal system protein YbgF
MSDRLSSLEVQQAEERDKKKAPAPAPAPPLRVVHLGDPDASEGKSEGDTEDLNPRPTIKIQGSSPRAKGGGQQLIEQTMPDENQPATGPTTSRPSALDPEARKSYDAALALVNGKQYDKALDAFAAFLVRWPDHPYADNATYWRGECYFAKGEYARALEQFEGLVARFPLGNKAPDALLKAGISQQKLGNPQKATGYFDKLRHDFPNSDAAKRVPGPAPTPSGHQVSP